MITLLAGSVAEGGLPQHQLQNDQMKLFGISSVGVAPLAIELGWRISRVPIAELGCP